VTSNLCPECLEIDCVCNGPVEDLRKPGDEGHTLVVYRDEFEVMQAELARVGDYSHNTHQLFIEDRTKLENSDVALYERTSTLMGLVIICLVFAIIATILATFAVIKVI